MSAGHDVTQLKVSGPDELASLASQLAPFISAVDLISLKGDLGSGKTAFAKALIAALGVHDEVTSPTYALIHEFRSEKAPIFHCDFYRVEGEDAHLVGLDDCLGAGIVIAEWLDHVRADLPADRLEIALEGIGETRTITFAPYGAWRATFVRFMEMRAFLSRAGWDGAICRHMRGDASSKTFSRLTRDDGATRVLMDWPDRPDGEPVRDGKPYCKLVHLARDGRPFAAISAYLRDEAGLAAPQVHEADLDRGFLLVEDFGDFVFQSIAGEKAGLGPLYELAVDGLLGLRRAPRKREFDLPGGATHRIADYNADVMHDEAALLLQWYFRLAAGFQVPPSAYEGFRAAWAPLLGWLDAQQAKQIVLRDYHSPNLILREGHEGLHRLGVIDFQDAMWGHPAYDLVSLLQDARLDIPRELQTKLFNTYCDASERDSGFDRETFERAYALLGAQRNSKILGVFARLHLRDGKSFYLPHLPRIRRYLRQNLEHPALAPLAEWYARHIFVWEGDLFSDRDKTRTVNLVL
jgi:hypothetical protein